MLSLKVRVETFSKQYLTFRNYFMGKIMCEFLSLFVCENKIKQFFSKLAPMESSLYEF